MNIDTLAAGRALRRTRLLVSALTACTGLFGLEAHAERAFGYEILPLGQATMQAGHDHLIVSNIGASGDDGVAIELQPGRGVIGAFVADWDWWDSDGALPLGASLESRAYGTVNGLADQLLGTFFMRKIGALRYEGMLEWSPIYDAPLQSAEIRQHGTTLGFFDAVREPMVMVMDPSAFNPTISQGWIPSASPGGFPIPPQMEWLCGLLFECEYHGWEGVAALEIGTLARVEVDPDALVEIFTGAGAPSARIDTLSRVEYRFADVGKFEFTSLRAFDLTADGDGDGTIDDADNCTLSANADQRDSDRDGIGNACDADFNQDCNTGFADLNKMKQTFFSTDPDTDLNGDGVVGFEDLNELKQRFFVAPGPSGIPNLCD